LVPPVLRKSFGWQARSGFLASVRAVRFLALAALLAVLAAGGWWVHGWTARTSPLEPRGGLWFPRAVLNDVPHFAQADPQWASQRLGPTP
jgi:hypothetical protein